SQDSISALGAKEKRYADKRELKPGRRLSCSSTIQGDLVVDIPADVQVNAQVVRKADDGRHIDRNPTIHLCYVEVCEPDMHNPLGDFDRLKAELIKDWDSVAGDSSNLEDLTIDHHLLTRLQPILRKGKWKVTAAIHKDGSATRPALIGLYPGLHNEAYGIACDIGSTTIAMHLVSLLSGATIATSGTSNPQIRFGEDLMSRVSWVMMNPDGR
ncbi:MAG: drug:proton antiporter, partial [Gammaproteobacteria bacterium]|nr:drug:proton antiporter [Gammaproteobacteria bacterium]